MEELSTSTAEARSADASGSAETRHVRYVFLDVVGFTQKRSVEAQTDIVAALNGIVRDAADGLGLVGDSIIFLPTGDGLCAAVVAPHDPYDVHVLLAMGVLERVSKHNANESDAMRRFQVRVGVNENVDNVLIDINGRRNVAGAGINTAQRVMSLADGGQLVVGPTVFDLLRHRERYMGAFRSFTARIKHAVQQ